MNKLCLVALHISNFDFLTTLQQIFYQHFGFCYSPCDHGTMFVREVVFNWITSSEYDFILLYLLAIPCGAVSQYSITLSLVTDLIFELTLPYDSVWLALYKYIANKPQFARKVLIAGAFLVANLYNSLKTIGYHRNPQQKLLKAVQ